MARTKQRTRIQDFIVTSGDAIVGEAGSTLNVHGADATAGDADPVLVRGGDRSGLGAGSGGDLTVRGGVGLTSSDAGGIVIVKGGDVTDGGTAGELRLFGGDGISGTIVTPGADVVLRGGAGAAFGGADGDIILDYATWPPADGSSGEILTTNGAGTLSWSASAGASAGAPGNVYENLVFYVDSADNNSYPGTGTTVTDIQGNGTNGTLTGTTFSDGAWEFDGATGDLTFTKNATLDNIFDSGGTVIVVARPRTAGEINAGFLCGTVNSSLNLGWRLNVRDVSASRVGVEFEQTFDANDGVWRTFDQTSRLDPEPLGGFTGVRPWEYGSYSVIGVTYDNSAVGNDPTIYINGRRWTTTLGLQETNTPTGTRDDDSGNDLTIGNEPGDTRTWEGDISAVLMFDRELTPEEVCQVSNVFAQRYGIGAIGRASAQNDMYGQHVWIRGGRVTGTGSEARGGHISIIGGEQDSATNTPAGGVLIRGGHKRGAGTGAQGGDLILASGEGGLPSQVQLYAGDNTGSGVQPEDSVLIHGADMAGTGRPGGVTIRGGDAINTGSNRNGGGVFIDGGLGDGTSGGAVEIRSGGQASGNTGGQTGEIIISTDPQGTGGAFTQTEDISILTEGGGATAVKSGRVFIRTGDYSNNGSISTSGATRIDIECGDDAGTAAVHDQGSINLVAGAKAGSGRAGSINLTAGAKTGSGASATGGAINLNAGDSAINNATSGGGAVNLNAGEATGVAGPGGAVVISGGDNSAVASTGAGGAVTINGGAVTDAGSSGNGGNINLVPGAAAGSGSDGEVFITGKLNVSGGIDPTYLGLNEQSSFPTSAAGGIGYVWVRDDAPPTLMYTDDTGTDFEIGGGVRRMQEFNLTVQNMDLDSTGAIAVGLPNGGVGGAHGQNINSRIQYLEFGKSTEDDIGASWSFVLPSGYSGNGLTVEFWITGDGSASAAPDMVVAVDRQETGRDLNTGALWGASIAATGTTVSATAWITVMATATLSNAQIDSMVAGESGRIAIMREQSDAYSGVVRMTMARVYETP